MIFKNKIVNKFWRFSSSFQLGIPIIATLAILISWGTIVEAQYDAMAAKKMIYDSWMMWLVMGLMIYNLSIVVIDRFPWQLKHYPFITVHAGLITIVLGGFVTSQFGLDGQMVVGIGGKNNFVSVDKTDLVVYSTFNGDSYTKLLDREVDFFNKPPRQDKPVILEFGTDKIEILEYAKYARLQYKVKASEDSMAGASVRFLIRNANVQQVEQITQDKKNKLATFSLGPAKMHVGELPLKSSTVNLENEIYLTPLDSEKIRYTIFSKDNKRPTRTGTMKIGEMVETGWMGLELRISVVHS